MQPLRNYHRPYSFFFFALDFDFQVPGILIGEAGTGWYETTHDDIFLKPS
jgi:hypothetical protein